MNYRHGVYGFAAGQSWEALALEAFRSLLLLQDHLVE